MTDKIQAALDEIRDEVERLRCLLGDAYHQLGHEDPDDGVVEAIRQELGIVLPPPGKPIPGMESANKILREYYVPGLLDSFSRADEENARLAESIRRLREQEP